MDDLPINNKVVELDDGNTDLHLETSSNSPKLKAAEQDCNGGIVNDHNQNNDYEEEVIVDNGEEPKSNGHHASSCDPDIPDPDPTESPQGEINPSPPAPIPIEEKEDTQLQVVKTEETPIEQEEKREAQVQVVRQEEKSPIEEEEESRDSQVEVVKHQEETPIEGEEESRDSQVEVVKHQEETPIEEEESRDSQVEVVKHKEETPIEEEESRDSQVEVVKHKEETPIEEEEKRDTQVEVVKQEEETPIEEEESRDSEVDVVKQGEETAIEEDEKSDVQVEIVKQEEETKHNDADVKLEGLKCEIDDDQIENINAPIEEQDKLDSDVIVEETREPITEGADILNSESNLPDDDNKVEEETKPEEVHGQQKVEDQAKIKYESVSKESPELDSQIEVTDHLESELHQPCGQEDKLASSEEETEENQNSHLPVVEHAESEPLQVTIEEDAAEQSHLQSSAEVCHDTLITATDAVETEPCQPDDEKECRTAELADDIPVSQPSTHLESEYLKSGSVDVQLEVESTNGTDEVEGNKAKSLVEQTVFETELVNGSAEGQKIESEPLLANGQVENAELASSSCVELKPETDVQNVSAENGEGLSAAPVACADLETEVVQVSVEGDESNIIYSVDDAKAEARLGNGSIQEDNSIPAVPDLHLERETGAMNGFTERASLPADPLDDTQSEFDGGDSNPASKEELSSTVTGKLESLVSNGPVVNGESKPDGVNDVKTIESEGDQSSCGDSNTKSMHEGDGIEVVGCNGSLSPSPEDSVIEVEKRPFRFLIRVPRYIDDKIKIQIELAQKQVDERTRNRDDIRSTIQSRRAACDELRDKFEAARSEERAARDALHAKRHEMDSVQSVINRVKNETSIEDIDYRVRSMEHRIEHETVPLKEEKQLMREIKQLKQLREQLTSSLSQQAENQPTSDERVQVEERFKLLKREMDSCRKEVMRLEGLTQAARKIYIDENEKIRDLQAQFRAGDDLRQEAYIQLQNLKKQLYEKNKYFRMYKEESRKAEDYSIAGDKESLQRFCVNQVETLMELWNTNDEFRKEYVRCNTNSTIRRLRTLDGRSLGPDEEPPLLHTGLNGRVDRSLPASANKIDFPSLPASERGKPVVQHVEAVVNLGQKNPKTDSKAVINLEQKPTAKSNKVIKPAGLESSTVTVSSGREEKPEDENKQSLEEVELARKAEELRRAEEAAKLKEQRRLEEKTKAKEAEERKRRNAEKAQARAELRAQKEAELKEKEREKKARKKERKKEKVEAATDGNEEESVSRSENTQAETTQEPEIKEKHKTVAKRPLKPSLLAKQAKPKVVPPPLPLRNRSKKRMQPWMWILLVVVVAIALFLVGNIGFSFKFGLPSSSGF